MNTINVYTCKVGHRIVTVDRQKGVTPFIIGCKHPSCAERATSNFYRVDRGLTPTHEWYRPSLREYETLDPHSKDHVSNGGLLLREIDSDREHEPPMSDETLEKIRPTFVIDSLGPASIKTNATFANIVNRFKKRKKQNYSAEIVAACRYVGEHWTGDDGHLVSQAADRIEQLESLVLANDKERHLSGQLKNSAEMSEEAFSDLFSRWRASAAEYNRLRKLTYIPTKGEG